MALEEKDLQILAELGFCAVGMGNMLPARTIFNGLLAARPGHEAPRMGLAMSHYMVDEFEAAESILRELMRDKPEFRLSGAHLALARQQGQWRRSKVRGKTDPAWRLDHRRVGGDAA